jgi:copper chaperone CopZ
MEKQEFFVENIKCAGCLSTIKTSMLGLSGVKSVVIDLETEHITLSGVHINREEVIGKLNFLGYPEKGNNSLLSQAKSYVSCAVGKMSS